MILGQVDSVAISCDKLDKCNVIRLIKFDVFVTKSACSNKGWFILKTFTVL